VFSPIEKTGLAPIGSKIRIAKIRDVARWEPSNVAPKIYYQGLVDKKGKNKMVAIVASMRKLLC
jgi:hypothetical protein